MNIARHRRWLSGGGRPGQREVRQGGSGILGGEQRVRCGGVVVGG
jgi:hypothetical protein